MTELVLSDVFGARLAGLSARLPEGTHVVFGTSADGADELVRLIASAGRPRRGRILLDGRDLDATPEARARVAALLAEESFDGIGRTAIDVMRRLGQDRNGGRAPEETLKMLGLGSLAERRVQTLDREERRALGLSLVLAHRDPALIAVFEPLSRIGGVERNVVRDALVAAGARGAIVLVVTASPHDALEFSPVVHSLEHGRLVRQVDLASGTDAGLPVELVVRSAQARRLASALAEHPAVLGLRLAPAERAGELRLVGSDLARLSSAVLQTAERQSIMLEALHVCHRGTEAVQAETAGLARAAYEASVRGLGGQVPPASPTGSGG